MVRSPHESPNRYPNGFLMPKTVALLHTGGFLAPMFADLCARVMPDVRTFNIVDESLIANTIAAGELTPETSRRVVQHLWSAEAAGADAILVTCSSIGPAVDVAETLVGVPLIRVDRSMAARAVTLGRRIGVVATLRTTLEPTVDLIRREAADRSTEIDVIARVCDGAFEAVSSGDTDRHDQLVTDVLLAMSTYVDVIVLAQASMARVAETLPVDLDRVPILSSPELGVLATRDVVATIP